MYEITIEDSFDAAHRLPNYQGDCSRVHGHTYKVQARFRADMLDSVGMAIDFRMAKEILRETLNIMDHHYINELPEFSDQNPTAENIARFIYDRVITRERLLHSVSVWETPTSCATYSRED
ncbi:MAG: 6-carboxytetrahydropterin synthase QueD [Armatimonadota bacterium]|nr:6-carboxytetrahydropterin synthase QueD [bacterium]